MSKFYCIVSDITNLANPDTFQLLRTAAEEQGHEFIVIDAVTTAPGSLRLEQSSMMYRLGVSEAAKFLESYLYREDIATFYRDYSYLLGRAFAWGSTLRLEKAGLPSIPTIFKPWMLDDYTLREVVERLGGFPVVVKGSGGSHGSAVRKADTFDELKDMLADRSTRDAMVLRAFVHDARHIRYIVIGDTAYDAIEYDVQPDDFRTNAVETPTVKPFRISEHPAIATAAEEAVRVLGIEFGGVDILLQPDGDFSIAEVNFPCNFARNQLNTGADIAAAIIHRLATKLEL